MKSKVVLFSALLLTSLSVYAAQELTPEQAQDHEPFQKITIRKNFFSIDSANQEVSNIADKKGAEFFYINDINYFGPSDTWIVTASLYKKDAKKIEPKESFQKYHGVFEYTRKKATTLEAFDTVTIKGYYPIQLDAIDAVALAAKEKGAYAFFIARQLDINKRSGGNQEITALLYKENAPVRHLQKENAIPYDSEAAKKAIAAGDKTVDIEKPGLAASTSLSRVGFFSGQSKSTPSIAKTRYTVTLPNGTKIEELNNATAAKMEPFKTITFRGYYATFTDISYAVASKAADEGAKYYHIIRQSDDKGGGNYTIQAELFK